MLNLSSMNTIVTRFAPSPTGYLHMGHAFSALFAYQAAREANGRFLLRIEDIDRGRCRPEFEAAIFEDLAWLGLTWQEPVRRQSDHFDDYATALDRLNGEGLLYPCFCSRREIMESSHAPHGPEGPVYPGTCRSLSDSERSERMDKGAPYALRLDMAEALKRISSPLSWHDRDMGRIETTTGILCDAFGDVVLARKDVATSYHLSVTIDDSVQRVTLVTRGQDLFQATHLHRLLQALLDLPVPAYHHHKLLVDQGGRRLAKRHKDETLHSLRHADLTAEDVIARIRTHPIRSIL